MKRVEIKETDNIDCSETDLILDNGTVVSVDVQDLFENMLENLTEFSEGFQSEEDWKVNSSVEIC